MENEITITREQFDDLIKLSEIELAGDVEDNPQELVSRALIALERKLNYFSFPMSFFTAEVTSVLIVDDTELSIFQLSTMLKKIGMNVYVARNKEEALAEFKKKTFDFLVLDLYLPDYEDGFDLTVSVNSASTRWELTVLQMAESMWEAIGINTTIDVIDESDFMSRRKSGELACYTAQWMADFNDPDNFIYTFYGNSHNTTFRSLCYPKEDIMNRVQQARTISDPKKRISEYQDLERIIVQEDAAWIPLYSRMRYYVTSKRLEGIQASWNGSVKNKYREMSIKSDE